MILILIILCLFVLVPAKKIRHGRTHLEMKNGFKTCAGFDGLSFRKVLGAGASGTAVLVEDTTDSSAKVIKLMTGGGSVNGWQHEEDIYGRLTDLSERLPLIMKRIRPGSNCEDIQEEPDNNYGIKRTDESDFIWVATDATDTRFGSVKMNQAQTGYCVNSEGDTCVDLPATLDACMGTSELSKNCLVSILEPASGKFPLGKEKPEDATVRAATLAPAKALIFEIIYALRMAFAEQGFQHWDLKEANLMNREWKDTTRTEICFKLEDNSLRCILKAALTHGGKTVNVLLMDFDNSAAGGCENAKCEGERIKSSLTKHDAVSLKAIWENIRPDGAASAAETAFVGLIDAIPKTFNADAEQISEAQYNAYLAAYDAILTHAFFESDGVSKKAATTDCTGTCHVFPTD